MTPRILQQAIRIMDDRLYSLGVADTTVYRRDDDIVIGLVRATNNLSVLKILGLTAVLYFRPYDCIIAPYVAPTKAGVTALSAKVMTTSTVPAITTTTSLADEICSLSATQQESYVPPHGIATGANAGVTAPDYDTTNATVVLPYYAGAQYGRYVLGPAEMSGSIVHSASATLNTSNDEWEVDLSFTGSGSALFNGYAAAHYECYIEDKSNPPPCAIQAIELDGVVYSDPAIEASSFPGGATIDGSSSDPFTKAQATSLAQAVNYGELPVRFVVKSISTVSPASP